MLTVKRINGYYFATYEHGLTVVRTPENYTFKCAYKCVSEMLNSFAEYINSDFTASHVEDLMTGAILG